ncbi:uncharacterized protein [Temnothorax longispinosus]|uniref:uncharacterized protein n=1 Tax=Temnothorax longispinosus TaxID=300112 RepID=UPI003A9918FD
MRFPTHDYFSFISRVFGPYATVLLKNWIKFNRCYIKCTHRKEFLRFCLMYNIVPAHLKRMKNTNLTFHNPKIAAKFNFNISSVIKKTLRLELSDTYRQIDYLRTQIFRTVRSVSQCLPFHTYNSFFLSQNKSLHRFDIAKHYSITKKMSWLRHKQLRDRIKVIKPVRYFYTDLSLNSPRTTFSDNSGTNTIFSFDPILHENTLSHEIFISPISFTNSLTKSSFNTIKKEWFVNLSSVQFPPDIIHLLQLGDNFSLPYHNKQKILFEFIKSIENNIKTLPIATQTFIRNRSIPIINDLNSDSNFSPSQSDKIIYGMLSLTKDFLLNNPDVILTRADKGNITVAMDFPDYKNKMELLLSDTNTYTLVKKDPILSLTRNTRTLLTRWKNSKYISSSTYKFLYCSDGVLPRAYGLPKIHKLNYPLRIIVSSIDGPLHNLARFLHNIISSSIPKANSHIKDSFQLVNILNNSRIDDNYTLISLDVVSLFTNVPSDLAIDSICNRWEHLSKNCDIPKDEFIIAVRLILDSTYFSFNNKVYKQNFGSPMGSPLSPDLADLVLQDIETRAMRMFNFHIPFFFRYVDDIAMAIPNDTVDFTLQTFNSFHPRLQFTIEIGDNKLNFLDTTIINNNGLIEFDWYHKPTFSGRYLNYYSCHPSSQKRGTIIGLIDRAFLLSHPRFHRKNLELIISILLNNDYPLDLIFNTIHERLKSLFYKQTKKTKF